MINVYVYDIFCRAEVTCGSVWFAQEKKMRKGLKNVNLWKAFQEGFWYHWKMIWLNKSVGLFENCMRDIIVCGILKKHSKRPSVDIFLGDQLEHDATFKNYWKHSKQPSVEVFLDIT